MRAEASKFNLDLSPIMSTRKHLAAAVIAGMVNSSAHATLHTYEFIAVIGSMFEHDAQTSLNTTTTFSTLTGNEISVGNSITGFFSFDDSASASPYDTNGSADGYLVYSSAVKSFAFAVSPSNYKYNSASTFANNIVLSDNSTNPFGWDGFSIYSESAFNTDNHTSANLNLFDKAGKAIYGYAIPSSLALSTFHYANLHFSFLRKADGDQFHFYAPLYELTKVSPVPEPESALLALTGILLLTISRQRKGAAD